MKTNVPSIWGRILPALYTLLIAIAALWAMPINAHAQLYVSEGQEFNDVSDYNAKTGVLINPSFINQFTPVGLALSGDNLFVMFLGGAGYIGKYNANTGAKIDPNFITGLLNVGFIAVKSAK
jgi:hypothetical protein